MSVGWFIEVFVGSEEASDGGVQDGAVREVNGAWFMMVPKRRSQTACGIAHSAADHRSATLAGRSTVGIPVGVTI